jgi:hypothetical protein
MAALPDQLTLEHLCDVHIDLEAPQAIGDTPFGQRTIFVVKAGRCEGPKLRGTTRPGGGDWLLRLANGAAELDVRGTIETDDGALIYMHYRGVLDVAPAVAGRLMTGQEVDPSEFYFRTTPRFETGNEKYAWLNKAVCAAAGTIGPGTVSYRVFQIL